MVGVLIYGSRADVTENMTLIPTHNGHWWHLVVGSVRTTREAVLSICNNNK